MVAEDVNLKLVHVDDLQDGRRNEHEAQQDLQGRFTERIGQPRLWLVTVVIIVIVVVIIVVIVVAKQVIPPMVFHAGHLIFRHFVADDLTPALDFLRLVGAGRVILNGIILLAKVDHFLVLDGGATAITRLPARWQDHY